MYLRVGTIEGVSGLNRTIFAMQQGRGPIRITARFHRPSSLTPSIPLLTSGVGRRAGRGARSREGFNMARGINKVILVGNLGQDPDTKAMPSGMTVCNLRIATSESWKDKQSGEMKEQTEWHSVAMFGRLAEIAGEYLRKGSQVYIEGRLRTRKWQDKSGNDRYTTEIVANEMQMLGSGRGMGGEGRAPGGRASGGESDGDPGRSSTEKDDFDDDIPF